MTDIEKNKIADEISFHSNGDNHLGELLSYCLGRLCLKSAKAGNDWREELSSIDVPHIADWLKAAIINDDAWLNNVDDQNRPKKLMKFGSFEDVQKEADKAMLRANQQNHDIKLIEGDEELYMELEDGYHLVKLLTPAALDREGAQMQHCIGGGAYDECLEEDFAFLSLRDKFGKPHATIEVDEDHVTQIQGKQNQPPKIEYINLLRPYFLQSMVRIYMPVSAFKHIIDKNCIAYHIDDLPDELEVKGSLDLNGAEITKLPRKLIVGKNLHIDLAKIKTLPNELEVKGRLWVFETELKSLPRKLKVGDGLDIRGTAIERLPAFLEVQGGMNLHNTDVKKLPKNMKVDGDINLSNTLIDKLQEGLKVNGDLIIEGSHIKQLPKGLEVSGDVRIYPNQISEFPEDIKIGGKIVESTRSPTY